MANFVGHRLLGGKSAGLDDGKGESTRRKEHEKRPHTHRHRRLANGTIANKRRMKMSVRARDFQIPGDWKIEVYGSTKVKRMTLRISDGLYQQAKERVLTLVVLSLRFYERTSPPNN